MSGYNGNGWIDRLTIAGAGQFTGAAGAGLFTPGASANYGNAEPGYIPMLYGIGYDAGGAAHTVHFRMIRTAAEVAGGDRIRLGGSPILPDGTYGLTNEATIWFERGLPVPLIETGPPHFYYSLQIITTGKAATGTVTLWYRLMRPSPIQ